MTDDLLQRALATAVPAGADDILDAALALAAASGLRHLTMDDVARRAGIGRMTLYRRFGSREALVDALTAREFQRCLAELDGAAAVDAPIADQVAAGFATAVRLSREHPLLARLARTEPEAVLAAFEDGALLDGCTAYLAGRLQLAEAAGVFRPQVPVAELAELLVRVCASFVLLPRTGLDLDDPELGRRLLGPLVTGS